MFGNIVISNTYIYSSQLHATEYFTKLIYPSEFVADFLSLHVEESLFLFVSKLRESGKDQIFSPPTVSVFVLVHFKLLCC